MGEANLGVISLLAYLEGKAVLNAIQYFRIRNLLVLEKISALRFEARPGRSINSDPGQGMLVPGLSHGRHVSWDVSSV